MKVVFLSNFFNHHQESVSDEFFKIFDEYHFIQAEDIPEERKCMGYKEFDKEYLIKLDNDNYQYVKFLLCDADIVIFGSASHSLIKEREKMHKVTFYYSEHPFKSNKIYSNLKVLVWLLLHYTLNFNPNKYMLCSSGFTKRQISKICNFKSYYKWGYFPKGGASGSVDLNHKTTTRILWVGRFLDWKHPEVTIQISEELRRKNVNDFEVIMIGDGPMFDDINKIVKDKKDFRIRMLGNVANDEVLNQMQLADIFLGTSDIGEGWGAVINEAMSCSCVVVANDHTGCTPYLIKNGVNGFTYSSINQLSEILYDLITNKKSQDKLKIEAVNTIQGLWNAEVAANRLSNIFSNIINGNEQELYKDGPCSEA